MNRIIATTLLAASAALTGPAIAGGISSSDPVASSADRMQLQAGAAQTRTAANPWSIAYDPLAAFRSSLTRDQVRGEYINSRDEVAALTGEGGGAFAMAGQRSSAQVADGRAEENNLTRNQVRAEYIASRDEVAALAAEDSGAFALAEQQQQQQRAQFAGIPAEGAVH